jgi:hypothetical protein
MATPRPRRTGSAQTVAASSADHGLSARGKVDPLPSSAAGCVAARRALFS